MNDEDRTYITTAVSTCGRLVVSPAVSDYYAGQSVLYKACATPDGVDLARKWLLGGSGWNNRGRKLNYLKKFEDHFFLQEVADVIAKAYFDEDINQAIKYPSIRLMLLRDGVKYLSFGRGDSKVYRLFRALMVNGEKDSNV